VEELAGALLRGRDRALSEPVRHDAERSLFNILGNIIGAADHPGVGRALALAGEAPGPVAVPIPGRAERVDPYVAALAIGFAGHVDDFDDTHLATVIHPGAIAAAAALAVGAVAHASGPDVLAAFALGCEAQLRVGVAVSPTHYDRGWHITGTCGSIGAATTAGVLLGLDRQTLAYALSLAAGQTLGHREAFGTEIKAFHAGQAAANGVLCAFLARDAGARSEIGEADLLDRAELLAALAVPFDDVRLDLDDGPWELARNTFKPYPCGIVAHPGIDAACQLGARHHDPSEISEIRYHCHPLVPELMGIRQPTDGLEARFSAVHGVAAGLVQRTVGLAAFAEPTVSHPTIHRLRAMTTLMPDPAVASDEAMVEVHLADGQVDRQHVAHARGSEARPLTDDELQAKVASLVEPVLPGRSEAIWSAVIGLAGGGRLDDLAASCVPLPVPSRLAGSDR
jgi:2-methylcitrate dehydratase PrpD